MSDYLHSNGYKYSKNEVTNMADSAMMSFDKFVESKSLKFVGKPEALKKQENVSWFDQTWLGRGVAAASTTGEASDLLLEGSNVDIKTVQDFIEAKEQEAKAHVPSERMNKFQKKYIEEGSSWTAFFRGVARDPALMAELFVQSLGTQIGTAFDSSTARTATAIGAAGGAAAGAFTGIGALGTGLVGAMGGLATSMEAALTFGELIEKELKIDGKEFTDENIKTLLEGSKGQSIRNRAIGRGLAIGTIEALSGGLAVKATSGATRAVAGAINVGRKAKLAGIAAGVGVEAAGGATGEVAGRLAAGQEMDPAEIGFEAITGTVTAPVTVALGLNSYKKPTYKLNKEDVTYADMKKFIDEAEDIDVAMANIKIENDITGLDAEAYKKQNKAILKSQIDDKITDKKDIDELIVLAQKRDNAIADTKKQGINQVPEAKIKLEIIEDQIFNIISKYEGAVDIATSQQAANVRKSRRDISLVDTIDFLQKNKKFVGKNVVIAEDNEAAQQAYDKAVEEYNSKQTDPKKKIDASNVKDSDGFVVGDVIVVNKDVAGRTGAINVGAHELLHAIVGKHMKTLDSAGKIKLGKSFMDVLTKDQNAAVRKRLKESYKLEGDDVFASEEIFTAFSDAITRGEITFNEGVFSKLKNVVQEILRKFGIKKEFADGRQVYNFLKDYQKSVASGSEISSKAKTLAGGGTTTDTSLSKSVSRGNLIDDINDLQQSATTKADFQKPETFNKVFESVQPNGAVSNYIKSLQMSPEKTQETIDSVTDRLINFDPAAKRKDGSVIGPKGLGEFIMANVGFSKLDAAKKLFKKGEKAKRETSIDTEEAKELTNEPTKTTQTTKETKARVLKDLSDLDLQNNSEINAVVVAEVDALIEQNPKDLEQKLNKLIEKEFTKAILNDMGPISKVKGETVVSEEYKAWHAFNYDDIVRSLSDDVIKNNYKTLFDIKQISREKDKKVNPITGKITYPGKGIFEIKTNKAKWTKYFTQGGYTTLLARRKSLAKLISQAKTKKAVDTHIETNSNDINAQADAKLRKFSSSLDNQNNQIRSFDSVQFSYSAEFVQKIVVESRELYATGNFVDLPRALEQAFINLLVKIISINKYNRVEVLTTYATEIDSMADMMFGIKDATGKVAQKIGIEIKQGTTDVRLTSNRISSYIISTGKALFTSKDPYLKSDDGTKIINREKIISSVRKELKAYYDDVNATITAWNNRETVEGAPYKRKKGQKKLAIVIDGSKDKFPNWVHAISLKKRLATNVRVNSKVEGIDLGALAENAYAGKKYPSQYIEFLGNFFSLGKDETFNGDVVELAGLAEAQVEASRSGSLKPPKTPRSKRKSDSLYETLQKDFPGMRFGTTSPRIMAKPTEITSKANGSLTDPNYLPGLMEKHYPSFSISKPVNEINVFNKAIKASRSIEKPKGITVLDFDDTLATSKSLIRYTQPDGIEGTLTPEQYASTYQDLQDLGYKFDFSEFNKVVDGKIAPLFQKALKLQSKFGPENMFVLTARPAESAPAIFAFIKANGLNIPLENITGLANSTSEAKALWVAEKVGEGFNDFYFADDALQNVQAVDNMLNQFDVKRKVQQARVKFSRSMNDRFNDQLENVTGIESKKRFERTKARKRGADKGKFRLFIPPSHEDFVGLLYNFMGKGEKGNAHRDFLEQALVRPLNRGYKEIDTAKQAVANDYKALNKQMPEVNKMLSKKTPDGDFTYQDAIRVYLWDKHGYKIPGLSDVDQAGLVEVVKADSMLQSYAETLNVISKQETYVDPGPNWETGNIRIDLVDATGRVGRTAYFAEFQENADIIFSEENLNKIEAAYGVAFREALEDMLHRIKTGVNRPKGSSAKPNIFMNWLNASVAGVMFLNVRSSLLQQMSNVNYLNFADNNIFAAGLAFANQKQYWKDFAMIFNSDMLKQRRGGLQTDINGAELAEAIKKARPGNLFDQVAIVVGKALRLGFLPTQIGDNIAIATGGAAYYRNRVNKYIKDGLSKKEAETKAFTDFQNITQSTQQSARPDMTSAQQSAWIGKLVLNFLNTPSQYNRIIKKAGSDLINRRITPPNTTQMQSDMSNMSRILYYGAAQNLIFYSLQTALFAVMFGSDDEDEDKRIEAYLTKKQRVIQGSIDTILRGSGIYGVAVSTLKNMAIKFLEQREKGYNKDESAVIMEMLNFSPVVGIKGRRIVNAEKTLNYNKKVIKEMETFDIDNPVWSAVTNYMQTITTVPTNKIYQKTINLRNAADNDYTALQRLLFFTGYTTWSLNLGDTKKMQEIKAKSKGQKKKNKLQGGTPRKNTNKTSTKKKSGLRGGTPRKK
jgi:predicted DNA-binding protein